MSGPTASSDPPKDIPVGWVRMRRGRRNSTDDQKAKVEAGRDEIRKLLSAIRSASGKGISEFATACGITDGQVRSYEKGGSLPSAATIRSYARAGKIPARDLALNLMLHSDPEMYALIQGDRPAPDLFRYLSRG